MSVTASSPSAPWMTPRLAIGLTVVSALSLLSFLVLSAYAPELRDPTSTGTNVLSRSAIGFAGLRVLLEAENVPVAIDRGENGRDRSHDSLTILTPDWLTNPDELARRAKPGVHLIVLPKWLTVPDPTHKGWVMKVDTIDTSDLQQMLSTLSKTTKIARAKGEETYKLDWLAWKDNEPLVSTLPLPAKTVSLQTISGRDWVPILADRQGHTVLASLRNSTTYILSDPDLLNTHGLVDGSAAFRAGAVIESLRSSGGPVVFDVTLNGFRATPNFLLEAFQPPLLGATLCALLAAALIGFHAVSRFGTPRPRERVFAHGKRALADSTAGLIRMLGRQHAMAPRYALALKRQVLKFLGAPREEKLADNWLARAEQASGEDASFPELYARAQAAQQDADAMDVAAKLYRWKRGIMHERQ